MVFMLADVLKKEEGGLLVRDRKTGQEVFVHTDPRGFCVNDSVGIFYNGVMTRSLPPQITADSIRRLYPRARRGRCR